VVNRAALGVGAMAAQRLAELRHARRNEAALRARGAVEAGAAHYPVIVGVHVAWLASTLLEGRRARRLAPVPLLALGAAQALRYWAITSLGPQWTTRILVDPTAPPVTTGPYRYLRHPNYVAVATEIAALPLVVGAVRTAVGFSVLDAAVLRTRIRAEQQARQATPSAVRTDRGAPAPTSTTRSPAPRRRRPWAPGRVRRWCRRGRGDLGRLENATGG
jgi:methyltransferase